MSDIRILRRGSRAYITGLSQVGKNWIQANMNEPGQKLKTFSVNIDYVEDLKAHLEREGLDVKVV